MNAKPVVLLVVGLIVGGVLGYYYGANSVSPEKTVVAPASEQATGTAKTETPALSEEANPYTKIKDAANPFKDSSYQNPFAQ